jgi:glyoxylase-like metal-dependent hydrolase (beta-lactamase superfamily II)
MKRALKILGLVLAVLVLAVVGLFFAIFGGDKPLEDGKELGLARTIKDGFVAAFVLDAGDGKLALIDAGNDSEAKAILAELSRRKLGPEAVSAIFLTHGHPDHTKGVPRFPSAKIYAMGPDVPLAEGRARSKGPLPSMMGAVQTGTKVTTPLTNGATVAVGKLVVQAFLIPGHTAGSAAYLAGGVLFLGDSADADKEDRVKGAKGVFSDDLKENHRSLHTLAETLKPRASEVEWLAFAHSGAVKGLSQLASIPD